MKIEIELSENSEGTSYPWWIIIDPKQMMKPDAANVAIGMISGPFFSREEAKKYLEHKRHHYSDRAVVWCHSGYSSISYREAIDEAKKLKNQTKEGE